MTATKGRGMLELDRARSLARRTGSMLVDCGGDRWALEELGSPGAGRWPSSGSETWANVLRVLQRRFENDWEVD